MVIRRARRSRGSSSFCLESISSGTHNVATDFKSNLISRTELDVNEEGYIIRYRAENEDDPVSNARSYQIRLQETGALTVSELVEFLTSTQAGALFGFKEEIIQALNIVVGHPLEFKRQTRAPCCRGFKAAHESLRASVLRYWTDPGCSS